jgi:hypothetical protein
MMKLRTIIESGRTPSQMDDPEIRKIARHFSKNFDVFFERIAPGRAALATGVQVGLGERFTAADAASPKRLK